LSAVEVTSPPITVTAIGWRKLASPPKPSANGSMPAIIATVTYDQAGAGDKHQQRLVHAEPCSRIPTSAPRAE
jgi:hypothetical protein